MELVQRKVCGGISRPFLFANNTKKQNAGYNSLVAINCTENVQPQPLAFSQKTQTKPPCQYKLVDTESRRITKPFYWSFSLPIHQMCAGFPPPLLFEGHNGIDPISCQFSRLLVQGCYFSKLLSSTVMPHLISCRKPSQTVNKKLFVIQAL